MQASGEFKLNKVQLLKLGELLRLFPPDSEREDRCGIVDDWEVATAIAEMYCQFLAIDDIPPALFAQGPATHLDIGRHAVCQMDYGLQGLCLACPPNGE